jgi:A/G-specific adenine glycosylase
VFGAQSLFRRKLVAWFRKSARDLPWRQRRDPYAVLVSEIMLQQTQVATVIGYFERWMKRFPDFAALAAASEADVLHAWQGLGYYARARNLHRAAKAVMEKHVGKFPRDLDAIRALPGVGRYTAGAVATFAFDAPTPIVDANIARVLARLLDFRQPIDTTTGREALWEAASRLVPKKNAGVYNEALMELGALVCLPHPNCGACPVRAFCATRDPESLPVKKPRRKTVALAQRCAFVVSRGKILLEQQTSSRWRGLWTIPEISDFKPQISDSSPLARITFPFTHHRVTLEVFRARAPRTLAENRQWFAIGAIDQVAMPSPHRRALRKLLGLLDGGSWPLIPQ